MVKRSFTGDEGPYALLPPRTTAPFSPHRREILPRRRPFLFHLGRQANRSRAVPCVVTAMGVERGDMMASAEQTGRRRPAFGQYARFSPF